MRRRAVVGFSALLLALSMFMSAPARAEECQQKCEAEAAEHASAALQVYYINCLLNGGGMTDCMIQATVWAAQVYTQVHGECMDECQGEGEEEAQEQKRSAITKWNEEAEQADEAQVKYTGIPLRNLLIQDPGTADSSSETADGGSESSG